ncbi:hypothetical protein AAVH_28183 [Aphelenchoides avenae]|nr:hypothetical protein AAVH_28183 [Aphelenchus avenae]
MPRHIEVAARASLAGRGKWIVPKSVSDDVLCDVLRFFRHEEINEPGPLEPRWKSLIEKNVRALPLNVVRADIIGDWIEVSLPENGRVIQSFDDLKSLNRYAVEKLNIDHFGEEVLATIRAFLSESSAHLRVKCLCVLYFPGRKFQTCMRTLQKLTERLNLLELVHLDLGPAKVRNTNIMEVECFAEEPDLLAFPSCVQKLSIYAYVYDDTESFIRFVEIFYTAWNRSLSIELLDYLNDPLPVLSVTNEPG